MAITLNKKDIDREIDILEENIDDDLLKTLSSAKTDSITPLVQYYYYFFLENKIKESHPIQI